MSPDNRAAIADPISQWEKYAEIKVESGARKLVIDGFVQEREVFTVFQKSHGGFEPAALRTTLVFAYLCDVRDYKAKALADVAFQGFHPGGGDILSPLQRSFLQADARQSAVESITSSDVKNYPVERFGKRVSSTCENKTCGVLDVQSRPQGGSITLDNQSIGLTNKTRLEDPGKHHIEVKTTRTTCTDEIDIRANQTTPFHCPT